MKAPASPTLVVGLLSCLVVACPKPEPRAVAPVDAGVAFGPLLTAVGPRLVSNQTSQPLSVHGARLTAGLSLHLGAPVNRDLPLVVVDDSHAFTRLPAGLDLGTAAEVMVDATLSTGQGKDTLIVANDTPFPDLVALAQASTARTLFALSQTEDLIYALDLATKQVTTLPAGDGPVAASMWKDPKGREWLVVAHQFSAELLLVSVDGPGAEQRRVPAPVMASGVLVSGEVAFVAEQARDTVVALSLPDGAERWRTPVAANPRELTLLPGTPERLAVGSLQTGLVELLDATSGAPLAAHQPQPGISIVGGPTEKYGSVVMGGKAVRDLAFSPRLGALFVSSIGPNTGPNPDRWEVSMNGGVGVVDPAKGWSRHLGFGAGVTDSMALDDGAGLLYAADVGLGLVRIVDAKKLSQSDASAKQALLQEVALPVAPGFPLVRPEADFGVKGRAGTSLHSGPRALSLSADRKTLFVLNRFTGTVALVDVTQAAKKKAVWKEQLTVVPLERLLTQRQRRQGQVLYWADFGRTNMSCDACHFEGHTEGVFFEKTKPMRIYRSTTVRGSRLTPPYFTPASTRSLGETAEFVGARNRFHNPSPTPEEVDALALFSGLIPTLPNPFVGPDGAPLERLTLPDGSEGNPRKGLTIFETKAGCLACHPAPQYTTDQDLATRGRYQDVGTPHLMPLRPEQQDPVFRGFAPPALVGAWDLFPLLTTGVGGLSPSPDGSLVVSDRFPLRAVVERYAPKHGRADTLTQQERNDLLAFVLSL